MWLEQSEGEEEQEPVGTERALASHCRLRRGTLSRGGTTCLILKRTTLASLWEEKGPVRKVLSNNPGREDGGWAGLRSLWVW